MEQTVAVDGSVFKHHPLMKDRMAHYIKLFAPSKQVRNHHNYREKLLQIFRSLCLWLKTGLEREQLFWPPSCRDDFIFYSIQRRLLAASEVQS